LKQSSVGVALALGQVISFQLSKLLELLTEQGIIMHCISQSRRRLQKGLLTSRVLQTRSCFNFVDLQLGEEQVAFVELPR